MRNRKNGLKGGALPIIQGNEVKAFICNNYDMGNAECKDDELSELANSDLESNDMEGSQILTKSQSILFYKVKDENGKTIDIDPYNTKPFAIRLGEVDEFYRANYVNIENDDFQSSGYNSIEKKIKI